VFGRLWQKLKTLWRMARSERATPSEIAWAVAIGVFVGCTPALGVHGWLAIAAATLFKKNRLFAWLGSRISNFVMLPFIALASIQLAHRVRTGTWLVVDREHALEHAQSMLLDWCLGSIPVGTALALLCAIASYAIARRRLRPAEPTGMMERCEPSPSSPSSSAPARAAAEKTPPAA
jgi:uncharacterized protein (DUF2062 family)